MNHFSLLLGFIAYIGTFYFLDTEPKLIFYAAMGYITGVVNAIIASK